MFPKSNYESTLHRERKRHKEISIAIDEISYSLKDNLDTKNINILEFGCGDGFQIPYLKHLGKVVASDIYSSEGIKKMQDTEFIECEITNTPFNNRQFDVVFSNHVIEHIEGIETALQEIQRIGTASCIYAFSVPTNIWLLLAIPAQYRSKFKRVKKRLLKTSDSDRDTLHKKIYAKGNQKNRSKFTKLVHFLLPGTHGISQNFIECYRYFKIKNWQQLFSDNGFTIIKTKPLLLYGPSEWPIIPTLPSKGNLCSSVLFIMKSS